MLARGSPPLLNDWPKSVQWGATKHDEKGASHFVHSSKAHRDFAEVLNATPYAILKPWISCSFILPTLSWNLEFLQVLPVLVLQSLVPQDTGRRILHKPWVHIYTCISEFVHTLSLGVWPHKVLEVDPCVSELAAHVSWN